jgi:NhaA family Na+:H+ antiporter
MDLNEQDKPLPRKRWFGDGQIFYPWERKFERLVTPFEEFIHKQTTGGIILMVGALLAMLSANSPLGDAYGHLIHTSISFTIGHWTLERSLVHWINEGLMVFFFFVVGLEIKREILVGELSDPRQAALPIIAAIGGMVFPAIFYHLLNPSGVCARGWGVPMATDIAFCVGALVLLGRRVPQPLMMFLVALAIVDDLGAVLVIALFYTQDINFTALGLSAALILLLVIFNLSGIRRTLPYLMAGVILWLALFHSGIHATIAGILVAFCVPARPRYKQRLFVSQVRELVDRFEASHRPKVSILTNIEQYSLLQALDDELHLTEAPLQRMERSLHLPVALVVIPLFALTNAGVSIDVKSLGDTLLHPVTLGVLLGLVAGKFVGITGSSWVAYRLGFASLPTGTGIRHIAGVGLLGGIGFTMSIFISELSFTGCPEAMVMAKTGIILSSIISGFLGYICLRFVSGNPEKAESKSARGRRQSK